MAKIEDNENKINIDALLEGMSLEDQKKFIKRFAIQSSVIDHVIDYICGEDPDGWWTSMDDELRMKILGRVEDAQIKKWSKYYWDFISEAKDRLKEIREKQHIYWTLYHGAFSEELRDVFFKFCMANNIVSEYTTKQANEDVEKVLKIVEDALQKLGVE